MRLPPLPYSPQQAGLQLYAEAWHLSADNERRLARKCAELSSQAVEAAAKAQTAQVMSADDGKTIASLKEEVERSWAALEASHQKASCRPFCPKQRL